MEIAIATEVALVPMTAEMVAAVAKVHLEAFTGYMNTRIGTTYVRAFMNWFLQAERGIALIATNRDGQVLGYVVGAPLGSERSMSRALFGIAAKSMLVRPWVFFNTQVRKTILNRLMLILGGSLARQAKFEFPEPIMSLVAIGVSLSAQGKNIGRCLMQAFEARARRLQMQSLELSVYPDNVVARHLYESCGWAPYRGPGGSNAAMHYFLVLTEKPDASEPGS